jgi:hypothetical protein
MLLKIEKQKQTENKSRLLFLVENLITSFCRASDIFQFNFINKIKLKEMSTLLRKQKLKVIM